MHPTQFTVNVDAQHTKTPSEKPKEVAPFLRSLRKMLDTENRNVLRWTLDGKAFEIHDMQRMMDSVLPKYFKHSKYTSFQRQLNYFNFRKWTKSKAVVCTFSNPNFSRDQPELAWRITRKKSLHGHHKPTEAAKLKTEKPVAKQTSKPKKLAQRDPIVIKVPAGEASSPGSFPSPTDAMSLASELNLRNVYGEVAEIRFHEPSAMPLLDDQSLDWVDALYSSLEATVPDNDPAFPSFHDHAFEYAQL